MPRLTNSFVKAGFGGEAAIAHRIAVAAVAGAIEAAGLPRYGEVKWPRAGSVKGGHLQPDEVGRHEPGGPVIVMPVAGFI